MYYTFDTDQKDNVTDLSGNGNNAVIKGEPGISDEANKTAMNELDYRPGGVRRRDLIKGAVAASLGFAASAHGAPKVSEGPPIPGSAGRDLIKAKKSARKRPANDEELLKIVLS